MVDTDDNDSGLLENNKVDFTVTTADTYYIAESGVNYPGPEHQNVVASQNTGTYTLSLMYIPISELSGQDFARDEDTKGQVLVDESVTGRINPVNDQRCLQNGTIL